MADAIRFSCEIYKVQTLVDGGLRVTLDLPETALSSVAQLLECKQRGALLEVAAVPIESNNAWQDHPS